MERKNRLNSATKLYFSGQKGDCQRDFSVALSGLMQYTKREWRRRLYRNEKSIPKNSFAFHACPGSLCLEYIFNGHVTVLGPIGYEQKLYHFSEVLRGILCFYSILLSFCHFYKKNILQVVCGPKGENTWSNLHAAAAYKSN